MTIRRSISIKNNDNSHLGLMYHIKLKSNSYQSFICKIYIYNKTHSQIITRPISLFIPPHTSEMPLFFNQIDTPYSSDNYLVIYHYQIVNEEKIDKKIFHSCAVCNLPNITEKDIQLPHQFFFSSYTFQDEKQIIDNPIDKQIIHDENIKNLYGIAPFYELIVTPLIGNCQEYRLFANSTKHNCRTSFLTKSFNSFLSSK